MCPHPGRTHSLHELGVLVDQPSLAEHIGGSVFKLGKEIFGHVPRQIRTCYAHPFRELSIHHEVVHVLLSTGQLQLAGHDGHEERRAAGAL